MKKAVLILIILLVPFSVYAQKSGENKSAKNEAKTNAVKSAPYVPVHEYDPKRDVEKDLQATIAEAKRTNKRILLEVGGLWCSWCKLMDNYFVAHKDLLEFREKNFIMMKVNFSPENENKTFLSKYPEIQGYPHIYVLEPDGTFLHSQNTGDLEEGKSYNLNKFTEFLLKWALKSK